MPALPPCRPTVGAVAGCATNVAWSSRVNTQAAGTNRRTILCATCASPSRSRLRLAPLDVALAFRRDDEDDEAEAAADDAPA